MISSKNLIRILINTAIGIVLVYFWLKAIDINAVINGLSKINYFYTLPFILFLVLGSVLRAFRLKILLKSFKIPFLNLVYLTWLSQLLSFTIPIRIGEVSKGIYLSTQYELPTAKAIIWIFIDRFLDFWFLLISAFILLNIVQTNLPGYIKYSLISTILAFSLAALFLIILPNLSKKISKIFIFLLFFPKFKLLATKFINFMIDTFSLLRRNPLDLGLISFATILALIFDGLTWYSLFTLLFLGVEPLKIFLGSLLASLTYILPAAPGYVGSAQASTLIVYSYGLGFDKTLTSVIAILSNGLTLLYLIIFGLIGLYLLNFDLNLVWKKLKR